MRIGLIFIRLAKNAWEKNDMAAATIMPMPMAWAVALPSRTKRS